MRCHGLFPMKPLASFSRGRGRRSRFADTYGHTLLEMTIAMALGLIVTAGAVSLYHSQRIAFTQAADAAQINDAGMTALTLIGGQVQMAGFVPADMSNSFVARPGLFGCTGGRPVGADDNLSCEALATHSDGIAVRYMADNVSTWPSTAGLSTDCLGQGVTKTDANASGVAIVNRFYAKVSGSTGEPELYCEGTGKANSSQPLVEGVERMRLRYWLVGALSAIDAAALMPAQWVNVVAVDVCVLVRGRRRQRRRDMSIAMAYPSSVRTGECDAHSGGASRYETTREARHERNGSQARAMGTSAGAESGRGAARSAADRIDDAGDDGGVVRTVGGCLAQRGGHARSSGRVSCRRRGVVDLCQQYRQRVGFGDGWCQWRADRLEIPAHFRIECDYSICVVAGIAVVPRSAMSRRNVAPRESARRAGLSRDGEGLWAQCRFADVAATPGGHQGRRD